MDPRLADGAWYATVVLVTAAFCLIGAGFAGLPGSIPLALALLAFGGAVYYVTPELLDSQLGEYDSLDLLPKLWLGPVVAGATVFPFLGASAGEVQALGGVLGLVGMANYFLRPVYHLLYAVGSRFANV